MSKIHGLKDIKKKKNIKKDKKKDKKYNFGYVLNPPRNRNSLIIYLFETLFYFFKFFQKPDQNNNIIGVHEKIKIFKEDKVIECDALLDTGNEAITIVSSEILYQLGFKYKDFNDFGTEIEGIGGTEYFYSVILNYQIAGFVFNNLVAVITHKGKYDVIVSQRDISKMYHSGYHFII